MRAGLRFRRILLAGGLMLLPATALAQETTAPATTNPPATDAIGPRELQNFSLPGTRTQPATQTPAPATPAPQPSVRTQEPAPAATVSQRQPAQRVTSNRPAPAPTATIAPPPAAERPTSPTPTAALPATTVAPSSPQTVLRAPVASEPPAPPLATKPTFAFLPWLLAAFALAGGIAFLLWQRRPREAYAGGEIDLFAAPEPAPAPASRAPAPQPKAGPAPSPLPPVPEAPQPKQAPALGIVASRLRPSIEIEVQPLRCLIEDNHVVVEFELDLFNAGTAPARAVMAEASLFNPGETQDRDLKAFFANPVGEGNRIDAIPPMKRITLTSQVVASRQAIQEFDIGGRKSFVPVIAFNALYEWSGGKGQTSASYLVGRETGHDKLSPLHLDNGMREFRAVGARPLPSALRT